MQTQTQTIELTAFSIFAAQKITSLVSKNAFFCSKNGPTYTPNTHTHTHTHTQNK